MTYHVYTPLEQGRPGKVESAAIYCDENHRDLSGSVIQRDQHMRIVAYLYADLSSIPEWELPTRLMPDEKLYYDLNTSIDAIFLSASVAYTFRFNGKICL